MKEVEKDNWFEGVYGSRSLVFDEKFTVEFDGSMDDLKEKLGDYITRHFDVVHNDFIKYVENAIELNRFDYCQCEDEDGINITLTEENPEGYCADYTFYIDDVYEKVNFKFE
jgi:hypothetical protein